MTITIYEAMVFATITFIVVFTMVFLIFIEDFYRVRRTRATHPHHVQHKHFSEGKKMLPTKNYIYSLLSKKKTPAHIKRKLVEQGWKDHEAQDVVRHFTEQYLQEKEKNKGKVNILPKILFRIKK